MKPARKITLILFLFSLFFIFLPISVDASIEFNISSHTVISEVEVQVEVTVDGLKSCQDGRCYLLAGFQKASGKQYFGETKNHVEEWIPYQSSFEKEYIQENFFYFEPVDGSWRGSLNIRFNPEDSRYEGLGEYTLKVWRYTGGGKSSAGEAETMVQLNASLSSPTPTLTPTPTTAPTPTRTPTPTKTPTPTRTPTPTKGTAAATKNVDTQSPTSQSFQQSPTVTSASQAQQNGSVLGKAAKKEIDIFLPTASPSASPTAELIDLEATVAGKSRKKLSYVFFFLGGLSLIGAVFSAYKIAKNPQ